MLERDGYPAGVPCWVDTAQPDQDAAMAFYGGLFGWDFEDRMPPDSAEHYFVAQLHGRDVAGIGSQPDSAPSAPMWNTYIWVDNADAAAAKVKDAGGSVLVEPLAAGNAGRMAVCADPSGAVFCLWQAKQHKGAQLVNEPGTWNFSELRTFDPTRATTFYKAVFGWELSGLDIDGDDSGFWRMPGYGDFLERSDPEVRARQAEIGAPKGFEDAVAWLVPMTGDLFPEGTQSHWSITFAVDDTDAVVEQAVKLGGTVLVAPRDEPWVRMAVIRDPQGAVFTASTFMPPA